MGKLVFALIFAVIALGISRILKRVAEAERPPRPGDDRLPALARAVRGPLLSRIAQTFLVVGIVVPLLVVIFSTFQVIPAGHVGVATLFGKVMDLALSEGLNIVNPLLDVTQMSTQVQRHQGKYDAASRDLQTVHVEMVLNYRLIPERAPEVYQKIGINFARIIIEPAAQEVLKANTALHVVSEILQQRPKIKADVQEALAKWLSKYGIELKEAALANILFDPEYQKAIEAKQIEEQKAEQKRYELIRAERDAQIATATAKGKGDAAKAESMGVADAIRIKGEAEATYNLKVASSLTPTLIQQQYLARWNGQLPQYMLGGGSGVLLQLPGDGSAAGGGRKK